MNQEWRYYGRAGPLEEIGKLLDTPLFKSVRVHGRRRVGKSKLLREAFSRRSGEPPMVMIELPEPPEGTAGEALRRLVEASAAAGLPCKEERTQGRCEVMRFESFLRGLVYRGAAVVLDEFQNAKGLGLVSAIKLVIDEVPINLRSPDGGKCGKLFMTGSHQQQMLAMFRDTQPLFGRARQNIRLRQWSLRTTLEMAREQGFLGMPSRFLTMHAAFGGMPGSWEEFASSDAPERNLGAWDDDGKWRRAFVAGRAAALDADHQQRWDNAAFIQLSPENRRVLGKLTTKGRGFTAAEIRGDLGMSGEEVQRALETLAEHLEFISPSRQYFGTDERWRVSDNPTLFQMNVLESGSGIGEEETGGSAAARVTRLENLEGPAFERMAASWLKEMEGVDWSGSGVWRPGLADIDVMALRNGPAGPTLIMGGCKRNPETHRPARLARQFKEFMVATENAVPATKVNAVRELRSLPRRQLLLSPSFSPEERARYDGSGFECVDIHDMARDLGICSDSK